MNSGPDSSSRFLLSPAGWLWLVVWLVTSWVAADSLGHIRQTRQVVIRGTLLSQVAAPHVQVDADLRFDKTRCKIRSGGQQFIAFPAEGASDVWAPKVDSPASYSLEWGGEGKFELKLALSSQASPGAGRLTFRFAGGGQCLSMPFKLTAMDSQGLQLSGVVPPVVLERIPLPVRVPRELTPPRAAAPSETSEPIENDVQESGSPSEEAEIRSRAEAALLTINRISRRELRALYLLIDYLEAKPTHLIDDPSGRTQKIGIMLYNILQRRMEIYHLLSSGEGSFVQAGADIIEPSVDEGPLSESD